MKRFLIDLCARYGREKGGATVIIYALCLLPLMLMLGFALDGARVSSAKAHLQASVDAAVLAGAREYLLKSSETPADRDAATRLAVQRFVVEDLSTANAQLAVPNVTVSISETGVVTAAADANLPLVFGGLFGRSDVDVVADGAAQAGDSRKVEVILALDNTSSMFESGRFTKMREASKGFVNTMFDETPAAGLMSIGVVPWASVVNINSESPAGWAPAAVPNGTPPVYGSARTPNAAFEDRRQYLYEPEAETAYTAARMAQDFAPVDWRGCVRSAPNERRVTAGGVVSARLTDDSVPGMRWHASWLEPENRTFGIWTPPVPNPNPRPAPRPRPTPNPRPRPQPRPRPPGPQGSLVPEYLDKLGVPTINQVAVATPSNRNLRCLQDDRQFGYNGTRNVYLQEDTPCATSNRSGLVGTAKACVSDPTEFAYFNDGNDACEWQSDIFPWTEYKPVSGPNMNCPTAMMGLSGDRGQIIDKLNHMYPVQGGTQADIGLMWGLRALSPRTAWTDFFGHTGDKAPLAFNDPAARKIMILLTDGKNEAPYHYEGYYGCNEPNDRGAAGGCWKAKGVRNLERDSLDGLTLDSCEAIRDDYGVELYTIAVDITDDDAVTLLGDCAGDPARTFNISAAELDETFSTIAARELRLTE